MESSVPVGHMVLHQKRFKNMDIIITNITNTQRIGVSLREKRLKNGSTSVNPSQPIHTARNRSRPSTRRLI
jgi:hypothetical protein